MEPNIVPIASPECCFLAAAIPVTNSGSEVPTATKVRPITASEIPKEIAISQRQISEALAEPVAQIIDTIKRALEQTPAELSADIVERGIMMTGGGSLLGNLDKVLRRATSLPVSIAEDALLCVVMGTGKALEEKSKLSDVFASD